ncbi:MAG: DUF2865 domain-containing protein [Hyphomicrobiaceae bacterium]
MSWAVGWLSAFVLVGGSVPALVATGADWLSTDRRVAPLAATGPATPAQPAGLRGPAFSEMVLTNDWLSDLQSGALFRRQRSDRGRAPAPKFDRRQRSGLTRGPDSRPSPGLFSGLFEDDPDEQTPAGQDKAPDAAGKSRARETYRTVCVRTCDGFYWPISFSTTKDRFAKDRRKCEASCGSEAKLFVYRNPGAEPEQMVDLKGKPYSDLPTAFVYRTKYDAGCSCKPQPWSTAALEQHRIFGLKAQKKKGSRQAALALRKIEKERRAEERLRSKERRRGKAKKTRRSRTAEVGPETTVSDRDKHSRHIETAGRPGPRSSGPSRLRPIDRPGRKLVAGRPSLTDQGAPDVSAAKPQAPVAETERTVKSGKRKASKSRKTKRSGTSRKRTRRAARKQEGRRMSLGRQPSRPARYARHRSPYLWE